MSTAPTTLESILEALRHPVEFRTIAQYSIFHEPKRDITSPTDYLSTRYDQSTMRKCWDFLDALAGEWYATVVKELEGDLARVVCIAYLVFRALDIIERDTTLDGQAKEVHLRRFYQSIAISTWSLDGPDLKWDGPDVTEGRLIVEFDAVVAELALLNEECRSIIISTTEKMGSGMADFTHRAAAAARATSTRSPFALPLIQNTTEYDLYCHYTAGLVGEAISKLFVSLPAAATKSSQFMQEKNRAAPATIERPWIGEQAVLSSSFALLVKKTNAIRDLLSDAKAGRWIWPEEVVKRGGFSSLEALVVAGKSEGEEAEQALWVLSEMVLNALGHAVDALDYLVLLRNQGVFNFVALPAAMALATLELCFMNPKMFAEKVEVRKAEIIRLITRSTDPHTVAYTFMAYTRKIHARISPEDPNFLALAVMCGKVEGWVEHHYPSYITFTKESRTVVYDETDPRSRVVKRDQEQDAEKVRAERQKKRDADMLAYLEKAGVDAGKRAEIEAAGKEDRAKMLKDGVKMYAVDTVPWQLYVFLIAGMVLLFMMAGGLIIGGLWYFYGDNWNLRETREGEGMQGVLNKILGSGARQVADPLMVQR